MITKTKLDLCPGCGFEFCEMDSTHHQCLCGAMMTEQDCKENYGLCVMCRYLLTK